MERQTFSKLGLEKVIRKSDFLGIPKIEQEAYREQLLGDALISVEANLESYGNPLSSLQLNGKTVFKIIRHSDKIIERKITHNLRQAFGVRASNRSSIIENLRLILREGIPFRVYRLDIARFYESFLKEEIKKVVAKNFRLSPKSRSILVSLLENHSLLGGVGAPRGLPVSSVIAEIMMRDFDLKIKNSKNIFFYKRYVDDIIIVTSGDENKRDFLVRIKNFLPAGLNLNSEKLEVSPKVEPLFKVKNDAPKVAVAEFEYLGYKFSISNPKNNSLYKKYRVVDIDIAEKKYKRYKLRISRAFYDFYKTNDWNLLKDRIRYLSGNFRVFNPHIGKTKLAGIYHNYPEVNPNAKNLSGLDHFLRGIVLHGSGRLGKLVAPLLTAPMRREILSCNFSLGHKEKRFTHFSSGRISTIKKCWER